jgi:positive regulator of sigma E activity
MRQTAIVENLDGNKATVKIKKEQVCAECGCGKICAGCEDNILKDVDNSIGAKNGDIVEIDTPSNLIYKYVIFYLIYPLFFAITAYLIAKNVIAMTEEIALIITVICFLLPYAVLYLLNKKNKNENRISVKIIKIIENTQ